MSPECDGWSPRAWWNGMHLLISSPWTVPRTVVWAVSSRLRLQHNPSPDPSQHPEPTPVFCVVTWKMHYPKSLLQSPPPPGSPGCNLLYKHVIISHMQWKTRPWGYRSWKLSTEHSRLQPRVKLLWEKCRSQMAFNVFIFSLFIFIQSRLSLLNTFKDLLLLPSTDWWGLSKSPSDRSCTKIVCFKGNDTWWLQTSGILCAWGAGTSSCSSPANCQSAPICHRHRFSVALWCPCAEELIHLHKKRFSKGFCWILLLHSLFFWWTHGSLL